jgi:hypothetical protein
MKNDDRFRWHLLILAVIMLIIFSCNQGAEENKIPEEMVIIDQTYTDINEFKPIFYDIYSPIDAQNLFRQLNVVFDHSILNPVYNLPRYNESSKIAVNLGIYGADMSFCHMFGQTQEAIKYLSVISRLAQSMGISDRFISNPEKAHENLHYHPDSLFNLATQIYVSADKQLIELDRAGAAALILAGGWIEALYIAGNFYDPENPDSVLEEQIVSQKYSLDRLVALLSNQQDDAIVSKYLLLTRQLRNIYDKVEIHVGEENPVINKNLRTIEAKQVIYSYSQEDIGEIVRLVGLIRKDMVN